MEFRKLINIIENAESIDTRIFTDDDKILQTVLGKYLEPEEDMGDNGWRLGKMDNTIFAIKLHHINEETGRIHIQIVVYDEDMEEEDFSAMSVPLNNPNLIVDAVKGCILDNLNN